MSHLSLTTNLRSGRPLDLTKHRRTIRRTCSCPYVTGPCIDRGTLVCRRNQVVHSTPRYFSDHRKATQISLRLLVTHIILLKTLPGRKHDKSRRKRHQSTRKSPSHATMFFAMRNYFIRRQSLKTCQSLKRQAFTFNT